MESWGFRQWINLSRFQSWEGVDSRAHMWHHDSKTGIVLFTWHYFSCLREKTFPRTSFPVWFPVRARGDLVWDLGGRSELRPPHPSRAGTITDCTVVCGGPQPAPALLLLLMHLVCVCPWPGCRWCISKGVIESTETRVSQPLQELHLCGPTLAARCT